MTAGAADLAVFAGFASNAPTAQAKLDEPHSIYLNTAPLGWPGYVSEGNRSPVWFRLKSKV